MDKIRLALLGCGDVAQRDYLPEFHRLADRAEIVAVAGRTPARVRAVAEQYGISTWYTDYDKMLAETDAEAVANLTPIQLHAETTLAALEAGKHVYTEKPVASTVADAERLRAAAAGRRRKLVCAPCVMLFPQVRYAQSLLKEQAIGEIYSARGHGHMGIPPWHGYMSDPSPFFAKGGGPALDMGVYPLHVLTGLLGPVRQVTALASKVFAFFTVPDGPAAGKIAPVEVEDNWHMALDFGNGRLATVTANSVVLGSKAPPLELYGLQGTIALDPIDVGAPVSLLRTGEGWREVEPPFPGAHATGRRSGPDHHLGVEHLVECILNDWEPVLNVDHALHVLEIIEKAAMSAKTGQRQSVTSSFSFPVTTSAA